MKRIIIYTDGSCVGNEIKDVSARKSGIGVYFPGNPEFNVSECMPLPPYSNIRAEMYAVIKGILVIMNNREYFQQVGYSKAILIKTDSQFTIDLVKTWLPKWKKNGFKTASKKPVKNHDLVIMIDNTIAQAESQGYTLEFQHVLAHKAEPQLPRTDPRWIDWYCNAQVDKLALKGGKKD
jgi:ribonuclease HI